MATGQPLLLTWRASDKALRLYEFSAGSGFVQIATSNTGAYTENTSSATENESFPPFIGFFNDSESIFVNSNMVYAAAPINRAVARLLSTTDLTQKGSAVIYNGAVSIARREGIAISKISPFVITTGSNAGAPEAVAAYAETNLLAANGFDEISSGSEGVPTFDLMRCVSFHPTDEFLFVSRDSKPARLIPRTGITTVNTGSVEKKPLFTDGTDNDRTSFELKEVSGVIARAAWSLSGRYLFLLSASGLFYAYEIVEDSANYDIYSARLLYKMEYTTDTLLDMRIRKDTHIAISTYNVSGDTYSTKIYRLSGSNMELIQTIANFGKLMVWSADGNWLLDAYSKRLFVFDENAETFTENSAWMTNIVAGTDMVAISTHAVDPVYTGYTYKEAAKRIHNQSGITLSDLRVMMVNSEAKFNPHLTSIDDIFTYSGGAEVYSVFGNWPQGGISLSGVAYGTKSNGDSALLADDIDQILLEEFSFKGLVVYDNTTRLPIAWYDFLGGTTIAQFKRLVVSLSTDGIVSYR